MVTIMGNEIGFTVDAGLVQRLGFELVGKAETAVSELIKNSYDADAQVVDVVFSQVENVGGALKISDDGSGMNLHQLTTGFMRISSTDKVHNPFSNKFKRSKAGKKGIGRFATQRLGEKLKIITQTFDSEYAIEINIDWNKFQADQDITQITFPIQQVPKEKKNGTTLIINGLREKWSEASIKRVYRYIMELIQPSYLSERCVNNNIAIADEDTFQVNFFLEQDNSIIPIIDEKLNFFNKSLFDFRGQIQGGVGQVKVCSNIFDDEDSIFLGNFSISSDVHFLIHYFIYDRPQYYQDTISNIELRRIQELSKSASGVKLYRNGFRVLPYGEATNDWTNIDKRWSAASGQTNIPLSNKNLFGFVEVIDPNGGEFEETASREGIIENDAFLQLSDFLHKAIIAAGQRVASKIKIFKEREDEQRAKTHIYTEVPYESAKDVINRLRDILNNSQPPNKDENKNEEGESNILLDQLENIIEESGMLRVLAGLGLTIGEFTHEIKQFQPSVYGHLFQLEEFLKGTNHSGLLDEIKVDFDNLFDYTKYFSTTISQNTNRKKEPVDVLNVINHFSTIISNDLKRNGIIFDLEVYDFDPITIPMHKSEWSSILYNLYSNSKKAIIRRGIPGRILVIVDSEGDSISILFQDNGDGIPQEHISRVFDAFFSTSAPASFDAPDEEQLIGTGLGLKIVKDIIVSYNGSISLSKPEPNYSTSFKILIPRNKIL